VYLKLFYCACMLVSACLCVFMCVYCMREWVVRARVRACVTVFVRACVCACDVCAYPHACMTSVETVQYSQLLFNKLFYFTGRFICQFTHRDSACFVPATNHRPGTNITVLVSCIMHIFQCTLCAFNFWTTSFLCFDF